MFYTVYKDVDLTAGTKKKLAVGGGKEKNGAPAEVNTVVRFSQRRAQDKKQAVICHTAAFQPLSDLMASSSSIDIEGATQHLRDMLKLDRPTNSTGKLPGPAQV